VWKKSKGRAPRGKKRLREKRKKWGGVSYRGGLRSRVDLVWKTVKEAQEGWEWTGGLKRALVEGGA